MTVIIRWGCLVLVLIICQSTMVILRCIMGTSLCFSAIFILPVTFRSKTLVVVVVVVVVLLFYVLGKQLRLCGDGQLT